MHDAMVVDWCSFTFLVRTHDYFGYFDYFGAGRKKREGHLISHLIKWIVLYQLAHLALVGYPVPTRKSETRLLLTFQILITYRRPGPVSWGTLCQLALLCLGGAKWDWFAGFG